MRIFVKKALPLAIATAVLSLAACNGDDGDNGVNGSDGATGAQGPTGAQGTAGAQGSAGQDLTAAPRLIRIATTPLGSEVTGLYKTDNGDVFMNVQHPSDTLPAPYNNSAIGVIEGIDFDNIDPMTADLAVPSSTDEKESVTVAGAGSYKALGFSGDTFTGALANGLGSIDQGNNGLSPGTSIVSSQNPDFNAFVATNADGSEGYFFTAWEDRPGGMSRLKVAKANDGTWSVDNADVMNIDFTNVNGTMINCFGTLSPWGTPLTSEENYMAEVTYAWNEIGASGYPDYDDVKNIEAYVGHFPNPYDYGYIVEITDPTAANPVPVKHFTLGRLAHENAVVMPDHKTVYLTDDGSDKGFYKFVADTAGDLSSGTLYAAKITQDATADPAKAGFDISWISMGNSNNTAIEAFVDGFDGIDETDHPGGTGSYTNTSYVSQSQIDAWASDMMDNGVIDTAESSIPFVETHMAAKAIGATMEFRKMEGIDINYDGAASRTVPFMYVAMSAVERGMSDGAGDIQVNEHKCGIVYRLGLHADYNVTRMEPAVMGADYDGTAAVNQCATDGPANPDNLIVLDDGRVLIGEDTGKHENNMLWLYNPAGK